MSGESPDEVRPTLARSERHDFSVPTPRNGCIRRVKIGIPHRDLSRMVYCQERFAWVGDEAGSSRTLAPFLTDALPEEAVAFGQG